MPTDGGMTLVTAFIRPHMEGHVVRALHDLSDFPGFTLAEVRGQGRGRGQGGAYISNAIDLTYHQFLELQLVCKTEVADDICARISTAAWTGRKGDGVVFTTAVQTFGRIREVGRHQEKRDD